MQSGGHLQLPVNSRHAPTLAAYLPPLDERLSLIFRAHNPLTMSLTKAASATASFYRLSGLAIDFQLLICLHARFVHVASYVSEPCSKSQLHLND